VEDIVEARHIGPMQLKGIHCPVDVWELLALRADVAASSPYLQVQENNLKLREMDLDLEKLSEQERADIQKALVRALVHLSAPKSKTTARET